MLSSCYNVGVLMGILGVVGLTAPSDTRLSPSSVTLQVTAVVLPSTRCQTRTPLTFSGELRLPAAGETQGDNSFTVDAPWTGPTMKSGDLGTYYVCETRITVSNLMRGRWFLQHSDRGGCERTIPLNRPQKFEMSGRCR